MCLLPVPWPLIAPVPVPVPVPANMCLWLCFGWVETADEMDSEIEGCRQAAGLDRGWEL